MQPKMFVPSQKRRNVALGIVEIAEVHRARYAVVYANRRPSGIDPGAQSGVNAGIDPLDAERALRRNPVDFGARIVRTRDHTRAASDARHRIEIDDAVAASVERVGRADARARRGVALVAEHGKKEAVRLRKRTLLDGLDPAAVHADRDLMFSFAGDRACVAADAFSKIDRESVVQSLIRLHDYPFYACFRKHSITCSRCANGISGNVSSTCCNSSALS